MRDTGPHDPLTKPVQNGSPAEGGGPTAAELRARFRSARRRRLAKALRSMWWGLALMLLSVAGVAGGGVMWAMGHGWLAARLLAGDVFLLLALLLLIPTRRR